MKSYLFLLLLATTTWAHPSTRIIGGQIAYAGEFPYAAAIYKTTPDGNYFCTGSLLNNQWVITAGQCVDGATLFTIILGTNSLSATGSNVERVATDTYVVHPDFDPLTLANDIGLIKFRSPITMTIYIKQLYLPYGDVTSSARAIAYGWGQISDDESELSDQLNYVTLSAVSDVECRLTYGAQLLENMICFEGNFNEGTCYGDSGSPLIRHVSRGYTVIEAVASFFSSNGCETTDPSGYTKVYPYNDWINNVTKL